MTITRTAAFAKPGWRLNLIVIPLLCALVATTTVAHAADSLPSQNDGAATKSVVEFVEKVTNETLKGENDMKITCIVNLFAAAPLVALAFATAHAVDVTLAKARAAAE